MLVVVFNMDFWYCAAWQCFNCISGLFLLLRKTTVAFDTSNLLGEEYIEDDGFITYHPVVVMS